MALDLHSPPNLALIRAWAVCILGVAAIVYGLLTPDAAVLVLGFGALGVEPTTRAAVNGTR